MQPPVRSYNSGGPSLPRRRGGRTSKQTTGTAERPPQGARPLAAHVSTTGSLAHPALEAAPVSGSLGADLGADVAEAGVSGVRAGTLAEAEPEARAAPGPVVSAEDFEEIFTRFQTPLTNFIFRLVGNREQAYDLTQDVFVKAYRALAGGTTIQAGALSSWLYRIASNTATDALRRRRLIAWLPLSLFNEDRGVGAGMPGSDNNSSQTGTTDESYPSAASAVASGTFASGYDGGRFEQHVADRELVQTVLNRLPEKYRVCLLLYEHEGFSCAEIAQVLSLSPSAVKMRLMRARERFITLYKQETGKS
ncbi:MAG TPA: RNA polymerase sigma factor [Ktedonobacterales bacterium]